MTPNTRAPDHAFIAAARGTEQATPGARNFVSTWRPAPDDDEGYVYAIAL